MLCSFILAGPGLPQPAMQPFRTLSAAFSPTGHALTVLAIAHDANVTRNLIEERREGDRPGARYLLVGGRMIVLLA